MRALILVFISAMIIVSTSDAQSPMPVVVAAVTPAAAQTPAAAAVSIAATQTTLKALQTMKAANDEILKQQEATLLKLDEIEKAANDLRIYSKRG
jgi:hypothetical protein